MGRFARFWEDFGSFSWWKGRATMDLYRGMSIEASKLGFWSLKKLWHVGPVSCHDWSLCCLPHVLIKPSCHDGTVMWHNETVIETFPIKAICKFRRRLRFLDDFKAKKATRDLETHNGSHTNSYLVQIYVCFIIPMLSIVLVMNN